MADDSPSVDRNMWLLNNKQSCVGVINQCCFEFWKFSGFKIDENIASVFGLTDTCPVSC
jgi:hypothetical protein